MPRRHTACLLLSLALALAAQAPSARAQPDDPLAWSQTAARGILEICNQDGPDAARVAEHAEVWGWPPFKGYLEHPDGFQRVAGGESRRDFAAADKTAFVEATLQSGVVTSAAPAVVRYFRCNIASDQPVDADLASYFTSLLGPPSRHGPDGTFWAAGAAAKADPTEDAALKAVAAAGPGAVGSLVELVSENGHDEARLIEFLAGPGN